MRLTLDDCAWMKWATRRPPFFLPQRGNLICSPHNRRKRGRSLQPLQVTWPTSTPSSVCSGQTAHRTVWLGSSERRIQLKVHLSLPKRAQNGRAQRQKHTLCLATCSLIQVCERVCTMRKGQANIGRVAPLHFVFPAITAEASGKRRFIFCVNFSGFAGDGAFLLWSCKATRRPRRSDLRAENFCPGAWT
jgi:hypothetical protein